MSKIAISPLSRCLPVYVYDSKNKNDHLFVGAAEKCMKEIGYSMKKIDINECKNKLNYSAGLNLGVDRNGEFSLSRITSDPPRMKHDDLSRYKELVLLEYMLENEVNTILLPGDLQFYFSRIIPAIAASNIQTYDTFMYTSIKQNFPSTFQHPLKYETLSVRPLLHSPREDLISYCELSLKKCTSIIDAIDLYRKHSKFDIESDEYVKKLQIVHNNVRKKPFQAKQLLNEVECLRDVVNYADTFCNSSSKKMLKNLNYHNSHLKIPLTNICEEPDMINNYSNYDSVPAFRVCTDNQVIYLSNFLFSIVLRYTLSSICPIDLTIEECEEFGQYIKEIGFPNPRHAQTFISKNFKSKVVNIKATNQYPILYVYRNYNLSGDHSEHKCHKNEPLIRQLPVNEVTCWNNTFYVCIFSEKFDMRDAASRATLDKLQKAHLNENFAGYKNYIDLDNIDTISNEFHKKLHSMSTKIENVKFFVRPMYKEDLIWVCDMLTHLLNSVKIESVIGSSGYALTRLYKRLSKFNAPQFPTILLRYPVIEAHINDTLLNKTQHVMLAAPSIGLNFCTPDFKILQAHHSTFNTRDCRPHS